MVQQRGLGKKMVGRKGSLLCLLLPMIATADNGQLISGAVNAALVPIGWKEFHSKAGNCSMMFPNEPELISVKMAMTDEGFELAYDAYISAAEQKAVYMLLVAKYPEFVDESY